MNPLLELLIATLIVAGAAFALIGSIGLIKLPEIMMRLHGPTKASTLGVGCVLVASILYFMLVEGKPTIHEFVITIFLFLTAPITANFIAKAHLHLDPQADRLPPTGRPSGWATYDPPPDQAEQDQARAEEFRAH